MANKCTPTCKLIVDQLIGFLVVEPTHLDSKSPTCTSARIFWIYFLGFNGAIYAFDGRRSFL